MSSDSIKLFTELRKWVWDRSPVILRVVRKILVLDYVGTIKKYNKGIILLYTRKILNPNSDSDIFVTVYKLPRKTIRRTKTTKETIVTLPWEF